jgi:hypothetical protein
MQILLRGQTTYKPGSVVTDHLSRLAVANKLERFLWWILSGILQALGLKGPSPCSRQGLPLPDVTGGNCELLPRSFHPYRACSRN